LIYLLIKGMDTGGCNNNKLINVRYLPQILNILKRCHYFPPPVSKKTRGLLRYTPSFNGKNSKKVGFRKLNIPKKSKKKKI
jgi:hypothetical protein